MASTTTETVDDYVERLVGAAPLLSDDQRHVLATTLGGVR